MTILEAIKILERAAGIRPRITSLSDKPDYVIREYLEWLKGRAPKTAATIDFKNLKWREK